MPNEFLHKEYELCFEQLRFYDSRHISLLRYMFTLTSSVATALFGLHAIFPGNRPAFYAATIFVGSIVLVSSLLLFLAMLQNRLYFVFVARQLNAIRGYCLRNEASEFRENQLYTKTDFAAIKIMSTQTLTLCGAAFLIASYSAAVSVGICLACWNLIAPWITISVFVGVLVSLVAFGFKYLHRYGTKSADMAIHGALATMANNHMDRSGGSAAS